MKRQSTILSVMFALLIGAGLSGCGDNDTNLFLQPFAQNNIELQVNQEFPLDVSLSTPAGSIMYVDIQNPAPDQLTLTPPQTIKFESGDDRKRLLINPTKITNGKVTLTFTLRDTPSSQTFRLEVK